MGKFIRAVLFFLDMEKTSRRMSERPKDVVGWRRAVACAMGAGVIIIPFSLCFIPQAREASDPRRTLDYEIQTRNVIKGEAVEEFYEIGGRRAYLTVDGIPVKDYFPPNP
jgi:hypothetical protein